MAWPNSQAREVELVVQSSAVAGSGTITNFPVVITRANLPNEMCSPTDGNRAQSDGADIRAGTASTMGTQLPIDVVYFEYDSSHGAGDAVIEIRVKQDISGTADTSIWLGYNTSGTTSADAAGSTYGRNAVYSEVECAAICDASDMSDRSGNHTLSEAGTPAITQGGKLSHYMTFGSGDRKTNADAALTDIAETYDTTVSALARRVTDGSGAAIWHFGDADDLIGYAFDLDVSADASRIFWRDLAITGADLAAGSQTTDNQWYWQSFTTRASNNHELYGNGASVDTNTETGGAGPFSIFRIGGYEASTQNFGGDIAQVIVYSSARSADWIATEYANQNDPATFIIEGTPQAVGGGGFQAAWARNTNTMIQGAP